MSLRRFATIAALASLAGCSAPADGAPTSAFAPADEETGTTNDTGSQDEDAELPGADAGETVDDTGSVDDTSADVPDTGEVVADTGSGVDASGDGPTAVADSGTPVADTGSVSADTGSASADASTDVGAPTTDAGTSTKALLGKYVMTWYSFQDNTPVNSSMSGSGRKLVPYLSVAVPFRLLKPFGGKLAYGDKLYVQFLAGRTMPNGKKHTGWVQIDDFCGDSGDDSYCYQSVGGSKYPNVDLYIGDFTASGMSTTTCSGPAGSGQELTSVYTGTAGAEWGTDYGGKALGPGKCGDLSTAKAAHGACWDYTPPASSASECAYCTTSSCTSW